MLWSPPETDIVLNDITRVLLLPYLLMGWGCQIEFKLSVVEWNSTFYWYAVDYVPQTVLKARRDHMRNGLNKPIQPVGMFSKEQLQNKLY